MRITTVNLTLRGRSCEFHLVCEDDYSLPQPHVFQRLVENGLYKHIDTSLLITVNGRNYWFSGEEFAEGREPERLLKTLAEQEQDAADQEFFINHRRYKRDTADREILERQRAAGAGVVSHGPGDRYGRGRPLSVKERDEALARNKQLLDHRPERPRLSRPDDDDNSDYDLFPRTREMFEAIGRPVNGVMVITIGS